MKKFYEVQAKCGHVGKGRFFRGTFYIAAYSGSEAATIARRIPRVKHDHKDAIISVREISREEYLEGQGMSRTNPYYTCKSVQEQRMCFDEIIAYVEDEVNFSRSKREFEERRQARIRRKNIKNKWEQKYAEQEIACAC